MFKDATEVERAEQDQDDDSARINAAIDAAEKAIAALAARQPDPMKRARNGRLSATKQFLPFATCVTTSSSAQTTPNRRSGGWWRNGCAK